MILLTSNSITKLLLLLLFLLTIGCNQSVIAQEKVSTILYDSTQERKTKKIVPIIESLKFTLNSQTKIGGRNKIAIPIRFPQNTIEWYYSVVATKEKTLPPLQLAIQMHNLLGSKRLEVNNIKLPSGTHVCDIYLLDELNKNKFENDNEFKYKEFGSNKNFRSGTVQLEYNPSYCYLGFSNPRMMHAVDITLDVVAVIEE